jgi:hypothetical protein
MSRRANLRCCCHCQWIYKGLDTGCPKCDWPSYSARYVFGNKAYKFAVTQEPWLEQKMGDYKTKLLKEIPVPIKVKKLDLKNINDWVY